LSVALLKNKLSLNTLEMANILEYNTTTSTNNVVTIRASICMIEHGTYTSKIDNNIIIFKLAGDFNEYGILSCLKAQKCCIETFGEKPCSLLVDCSAQTGATPEAYLVVNTFYNELDCENLRSIAIVHSNYVLARLEDREIPEMKKHNVKVFSDEKSAIAWLKES